MINKFLNEWISITVLHSYFLSFLNIPHSVSPDEVLFIIILIKIRDKGIEHFNK